MPFDDDAIVVATDQGDAIGPSMRQRPAFGWPLAYSGHSTCQMARHERAFGPLKAGGRRVEWYRYGIRERLDRPFHWNSRVIRPGTVGAISQVQPQNGSGRRRRGGPYLPELSGQYPRWPGSPIDDFRAQDELHVLSPPIRRRDAQRSLEIRRIRDELACRERAIRLDTGH